MDIYSNKVVWALHLIAVSAFKNVGYGTVKYLASIMNIDGQLYEAADLDGANMWQKRRHTPCRASGPRWSSCSCWPSAPS